MKFPSDAKATFDGLIKKWVDIFSELNMPENLFLLGHLTVTTKNFTVSPRQIESHLIKKWATIFTVKNPFACFWS